MAADEHKKSGWTVAKPDLIKVLYDDVIAWQSANRTASIPTMRARDPYEPTHTRNHFPEC